MSVKLSGYKAPNTEGSLLHFKPRYENFIGGEWVPPVNGEYFDNPSPVDGKVFTKVPRSQKEDIELALDKAHQAKEKWANTPPAKRSKILLEIADRIEANKEKLALSETWDNGKPIREALAADIPLAVDHFRYFAGVIRGEEGSVSEIDAKTLSVHIKEPIGVVGQIIPWNFPLLMAAWKLAPALAAGNCVVLKPAEQTPVTVLLFAEIIQDLLPPGVLNIVNGFGPEAGQALATSPRIGKIAFTGETTTGRLIMQYASENIIPVTLELGGKSPNIFTESVMRQDDSFLEKAIEGFTMFALNQGEVCTCPSRALIQESIYEEFMERALERVSKIKLGDPLHPETMMGAQASSDQFQKILSYLELGREEGAQCLTGGKPYDNPKYPDGFYIEPTVFVGNNKMRIFQEEIFGPVVSVTTFKDEQELLEIANDTLYGLGAGLWTRDVHQAYQIARKIEAGRVWVNCYHVYPAHAAFGGYKQSGIGRETHKMMLEHYQQTKNMLISYDQNPTGLF
ncbi:MULTISPECIES: aldehyde dehydrogenase family protein [Thermoactinomyces]|jgi:aldehyde dehydrogenase|uniref:Putative aldehyde dehydrogenase AldA n=1 Tax=Thermoactinomyces vulgaris TaxID=2026 RepID=A0ABS0QIJ4_THEVU|nr:MULTISPECIES: aldehyde dehydrogenase family protein [Thermoactinomyces]MBA4552071.1 aldehyde dehydrogenase [Thermoactinomyces vulgaris]MBA4597439.1 aldehyde dehydrogenase [Thermoactinomyces vulgaris]MBH8586708.1 aldehyde dehydrogenase [Thermoactinomyces sp. CICC 10520]MBH8589015.1 aldehyde dehydrogenase [Thermoactinomyces vulgaris]MCF6133701.1 aldehyde dehydrogenase [Thermoactinomyces vulgaris]